MKINLITTYFDSKSDHQKEIDFCILKNIDNKFIDRIFIFAETKVGFDSSKIEIIDSSEMFKFSHAIDYANKNLNGEIIIISNSDIFFDDKICLLKQINFNNLLLALTRVDYIDGEVIEEREVFDKFYPGGGYKTLPHLCHDSWVFVPPIKEFNADIILGQRGCDHFFVQNAQKVGINVLNGYKFIKTYHVHKNNVRSTQSVHTYKCKMESPYAADQLPWII